MSKKAKKQAEQGTWAICITAGLIIGVGLGPLSGNFLITLLICGAIGVGAGYFFTHQKKRSKR
ncbi:MAG: hypothetical protein OXU66_16160 [Gammaproteobacteria bacterium]|nr:hypothetical protein [Gammaproteobacteria bacterium]MDD9960451.1 hypothetical protein [Gammaproteobacteria bacterium]